MDDKTRIGEISTHSWSWQLVLILKQVMIFNLNHDIFIMSAWRPSECLRDPLKPPLLRTK